MTFAVSMLLALLVDALLGWPGWLFRRIGHPVTWLGRLIARLDRALNRNGQGRARRRIMGVITVMVVVTAAGLPALAAVLLVPDGWGRVVICGLLAWPFVAARSLHEHVAAVARPLQAKDIDAARSAVSMIVGRDPSQLDEAGIARAAIESLAENASDGVVAPLFWGLVAGLPGIVAYKAVNTMDSMIGHRSARHEDFGKAAARLDDLLNLVPSRLTGLLVAAAGPHPRAAVAAMRRDAGRHRSPNAGWPEAAMAGALGVRLSGPRVYAEGIADEPWLNGDAPDPAAGDLARGLRIFRRAMAGVAAVLLMLAIL